MFQKPSNTIYFDQKFPSNCSFSLSNKIYTLLVFIVCFNIKTIFVHRKSWMRTLQFYKISEVFLNFDGTCFLHSPHLMRFDLFQAGILYQKFLILIALFVLNFEEVLQSVYRIWSKKRMQNLAVLHLNERTGHQFGQNCL